MFFKLLFLTTGDIFNPVLASLFCVCLTWDSIFRSCFSSNKGIFIFINLFSSSAIMCDVNFFTKVNKNVIPKYKIFSVISQFPSGIKFVHKRIQPLMFNAVLLVIGLAFYLRTQQ